MSIKIKVEGVDEIIKQLDDVKSLEKVDHVMQMAVLELEREIKKTPPCPVDSGRYRAGWHTMRVKKLTYQIINNVEYAKFLIYGTSKMSVKHDVRGIVERWTGRLKKMLKSNLR
jgi:hypothetical protein